MSSMASDHHTSGLESSDAGAVINRHSRSFSIASRLLPSRVRTPVHALYAWCRTVDDAVDEVMGEGRNQGACLTTAKGIHGVMGQTPSAEVNGASVIAYETAEQILNVMEEDLDRIQRGQPALHQASSWIEPLIVERLIDVRHAKELIAGMRMDLQSFRVTNDEDLQRYCYHAAGTVGLMMTRLMGVQNAASDRHAIALGVAMQLTNIARDVREDAERGRIYLPGLADPLGVDSSKVRSSVAEILSIAERQYEIAAAGLHYLPKDCRFAIRMALSLYREIGRQIARNDYAVLHGRTIISKSRLMRVFAATLYTSLSNDFQLSLPSIPFVNPETPMNDSQHARPSTVSQAKHVVYLGLSLTAIMAAALFVMVFMNPKEASYSYLPIVYSGLSLTAAIVFNRLASRCEKSQALVEGGALLR